MAIKYQNVVKVKKNKFSLFSYLHILASSSINSIGAPRRISFLGINAAFRKICPAQFSKA